MKMKRLCDQECARLEICHEQIGTNHDQPVCVPNTLSHVRLSVCRLSVTIVRPVKLVEMLGNFSTPFVTLAIRRHPRKKLRRSSEGNPTVGGGG